MPLANFDLTVAQTLQWLPHTQSQTSSILACTVWNALQGCTPTRSSGHSLLKCPLGSPVHARVLGSLALFCFGWWEPAWIIDFTGIVYLCPLLSNADDGRALSHIVSWYSEACGWNRSLFVYWALRTDFSSCVVSYFFLTRQGEDSTSTSPTARAEKARLECLRLGAL